MKPSQPTANQPVELRLPHLPGRYRPRGRPFLSPGCWSCTRTEIFLIGGWDLTVPGCGRASPISCAVTLAIRWPHEPQSIINQPVGRGFPHLVGRYRPGGCPFSSAGCWSCRCKEVFLIKNWGSIAAGCRSLHEPQQIRDQPMGVSTRRVDVFLFPFGRSCRYMEGFQGVGPYLPRVWRNLDCPIQQ